MKGLPTPGMLRDLVEDVLKGDWPEGQEQIDAFLDRLDLVRTDTAPGHQGQAFRLGGDRDLAADYLIVHEFRSALVGIHALANGPAEDVLRTYELVAQDLTTLHGPPEKAYDRRRPPSEVSHWVLPPSRISLFCHADHHSPARTIQLAIEHIERSAFADLHG